MYRNICKDQPSLSSNHTLTSGLYDVEAQVIKSRLGLTELIRDGCYDQLEDGRGDGGSG
jgi:hypothetical protein